MKREMLAVDQVLEDRLRYASGEKEFEKLATDYGVHRMALQKAVLGHTLRRLPVPPRSSR